MALRKQRTDPSQAAGSTWLPMSLCPWRPATSKPRVARKPAHGPDQPVSFLRTTEPARSECSRGPAQPWVGAARRGRVPHRTSDHGLARRRNPPCQAQSSIPPAFDARCSGGARLLLEKVMSHTATESSSTRRPPSTGRATHQPPRPRDWSGLNAPDILARYRPGRADPMQVLEVLLKLFNERHTARMKTVSHKTRQERAGFKTLPDPRNLGQKHIHAMVQVWREDKLKPATIQTYLSFLRGLAKWLG